MNTLMSDASVNGRSVSGDAPAVEICDVTKTFGETIAVKNLSLSVPRGSIYGLIGPNGSGKTTTIRMIMNIFYPDTGAVRLFGRDVGERAFEEVGYLPEERGLYRKMKVFEVLQFYGELKTRRHVDDEIDVGSTAWNCPTGQTKKSKASARDESEDSVHCGGCLPSVAADSDEPFSGLDR